MPKIPVRGVSSGPNSHGAQSTGVASQGASVESAASSHTRGKMACLKGWMEVKSKGRGEKRGNKMWLSSVG